MSLHESMAEAVTIASDSIKGLCRRCKEMARTHPHLASQLDEICVSAGGESLSNVRDALDHAENLTRSASNAEPTKSEATVNQQAIAMAKEVADALGIKNPPRRRLEHLAIDVESVRCIPEEEHREMQAQEDACETDA